MKTVNVTFSIPEEINIALHACVQKRGLSRFVSEAIRKALRSRKNDLKAAFIEAENDPDDQAAIADWAAIDGDSWDA